MATRRSLITEASAALAAAGVPSPAYDAEELLAFVMGIGRQEIVLVGEVAPDVTERFWALVARRVRRQPLQHLIGTAAFRYVELAVGPGAFVPRPETELLAGWAVDRARELESPVVVDLCTGSGAIARSLADEVPQARVHAVELSEEAFGWAARNLADTGVDLRLGDFATAFDDLLGAVDVVVCNPPYVPLEAWESVAPEARDHDPHLALFSGDDGLDAIRVLADRGARLLRPGGVIGVEHADVQGTAAPDVFARAGHWHEIRDHRDLADRPRYLTARRVAR
ncbi:peptide chain release factor N(5)-glutamine methyltransferase [Nocardioides sambongensis]|uniref:peptide chain release factor N(5)-glutamine methyltransferase n=1 Tax=Nocardioides sambongensis TaxID=2589074 RepID=UPI001128C08D|nr:peptide chain release factor N(5)-glutamine methyltransferase [Nocardioides sambongensis]